MEHVDLQTYLSDAYTNSLTNILRTGESLSGNFTRSWKYFGFNRTKAGICFREFAPNAVSFSLKGDFNGWNNFTHMGVREKENPGVWRIDLKEEDDFIHGHTQVRVSLLLRDGTRIDRVPSYANYVVQNKTYNTWNAVYWDFSLECGDTKKNHTTKHCYKKKKQQQQQQQYQYQYHHIWINSRPPMPIYLRIYEAHIGMSTEKKGVSTFNEFTESVLPWIVSMGYTCIQLMGVVEHPYYASFGYQVSSFYAPSSRLGTPSELKRMVDIAHGMGLIVLLDVVHSHSCTNVEEGLNYFDGKPNSHSNNNLYFKKETHPDWGTRLFDYSKRHVIQFLLSNLRYWVEEYMIDGFRMDAVTSMIYTHHGVGTNDTILHHHHHHHHNDSSSSSSFHKLIDPHAVAYLMMANYMLHHLFPHKVITIAEEVTGFPGTCVPVSSKEGEGRRVFGEGDIGIGLGFDYRLAMGIPPLWEYMITKEERGEDSWGVKIIAHDLLNRVEGRDPTIGYVECHDQSIVGSSPIALKLMGDKASIFMSKKAPLSFQALKAFGLIKIIRAATLVLGSSHGHFLDFIGNEWAHPTWVDFPRKGNHNNFSRARRRWSLVNNIHLRHSQIASFTKALFQAQDDSRCSFKSPLAYNTPYLDKEYSGDTILVDEGKGLLTIKRGDTWWVFNFTGESNHVELDVNKHYKGVQVLLNSDATEFAGLGDITYPAIGDILYSDIHNHIIFTTIPPWSVLIFATKC